MYNLDQFTHKQIKVLTNLHKSPTDFYLFVSELVQVIHK
jgi:hypothetical protein